MIIKDIIDEDFVNYKFPSMVIEFPYCSMKCDKEFGVTVCQNSSLHKQPNIDVDVDKLIQRYKSNLITRSIVCQGLEPMDSFDELISFISALRNIGINDDVVIYTGYTKDELIEKKCLEPLIRFKNIIVKFGRYVPDNNPHYDDILGVNLISDNQYAERIS